MKFWRMPWSSIKIVFNFSLCSSPYEQKYHNWQQKKSLKIILAIIFFNILLVRENQSRFGSITYLTVWYMKKKIFDPTPLLLPGLHTSKRFSRVKVPVYSVSKPLHILNIVLMKCMLLNFIWKTFLNREFT